MKRLALVLLVLACSKRTFDLPGIASDGGAGAGGTSPTLPDAGAAGGGPGSDGPVNPAPDGPLAPDDAPRSCMADLQTDPAHCGRCGNVCSFANALPSCQAGRCVQGSCLPGLSDQNGNPADGCEYACTSTNEGKEICDERDNDCNGKIDEATDKQTDLANCGRCGNQCALLHAQARCQAGQCLIASCQEQWRDANGMALDGCECQLSNNGVEACDGFDNDCNGKLDDVPDTAFTHDAQNCGACRRNCLAIPHAAGKCEASACAILACEFGFGDVDKKIENGCEQACPGGFEGGVEICDGIDNDCDGKLDAADDSLLPLGNNFCEQRGACAGSSPKCVGDRWTCDYGPDVQLSAPNLIIGDESWCDGKDNDCDGCIDEPFAQVAHLPSSGGTCAPTLAQECSDKGIGACQARGTFVCGSDKTSVTCSLTAPAAKPSPELCDGIDNDCDGTVDNSAPGDPARIKDAMVAISGGGLPGTVYIATHEASRPDASATSAGKLAGRACVKAGVMPWSNVTHPEAAAACAAAGKRLCTEAEWQRACETPAAPACTWSFATQCTTQSAQTCNSHERDGDPASPGDQDLVTATGALASCHAAWGTEKIFDLTGNLSEWTKARSAGKNPVRGGGFDTLLAGSTCRFDFATFDDSFRFGDTGFRCCSDLPP